jgi:hypothetical protein
MQLVRNGFVIVLLIGVGYAVYTYVNKPAPVPPPGTDLEMPELAIDNGTLANPGAEVDLGKAFPGAGSAEPARIGDKSAHTEYPPGDEAPPFNPANNSPSGTSTSDARRDLPYDNAAADARGGDRAALTSGNLPSRNAGNPIANAPSDLGGSAKSAPRATGKFADAWRQAQQQLADNRLVEALSLLSPWYGDRDLLPNEEQQLVALLGQLAGTVIYSDQDHLLEPPYIVHDGETLRDIAQQYKISPDLLAKINHRDVKDPGAIRPGDRLKVVRGPFDAVVDLSRKEVLVQLRGNYAGRFKIIRSGVTSAQFKQASTGLQVKEKANVAGEHLVSLENAIGIYGEDYSPNALKMPKETSVVLSAGDAEDVFDILTMDSAVAIAP